VGCSPAAIEWMECALDPFPDGERNLAGYPDMITAKSIVQSFRQKQTLNGPGAGNWDCSVAYDGCFNAAPVVTQNPSANQLTVSVQGATPYNMGGVNVRWAASGTNLDVPTTINASCMAPIVNLGVPFRVLAVAIEIWNTTAPLYRQGNCVVWRQPRTPQDRTVNTLLWTPVATNYYGSTMNYTYPPTPSTATNALILNGSQSWSAEKGVYMVGTLAKADIPIWDSGVANSTAYEVVSNGQYYTTSITTGGTQPYIATSVCDSNFNQFGAYFTGLSQQTTLDVVWHYVVERFPNATQTDLVTMASNSCPYDPRTLELYSRTVWHLPTGCWVEENGLGDWICSVADTLGSFGVPGMGIVKGVVNGLGMTAKVLGTPDSFGASNNKGPAPEQRTVSPPVKVQRVKPARIGPRLPTGKFHSEEAKAKKRKRKAKALARK